MNEFGVPVNEFGVALNELGVPLGEFGGPVNEFDEPLDDFVGGLSGTPTEIGFKPAFRERLASSSNFGFGEEPVGQGAYYTVAHL